MVEFFLQLLNNDQAKDRQPVHRRLRGRALLALVIAMLITVSTVSAHSRLVQSEPANGQALDEPPEKVVAWFSEELDSGLSEMQVLDVQGRQIDNGDGGVDLNDLDHLTMVVTLPSELSASTYTVHWVAASAEDGDLVEGDFTFGVGLVPSQTSPQPEASSTPVLWALTGLFAIILVAVGVTAVHRRRNPRLEERLATQRINGQVNQS